MGIDMYGELCRVVLLLQLTQMAKGLPCYYTCAHAARLSSLLLCFMCNNKILVVVKWWVKGVNGGPYDGRPWVVQRATIARMRVIRANLHYVNARCLFDSQRYSASNHVSVAWLANKNSCDAINTWSTLLPICFPVLHCSC